MKLIGKELYVVIGNEVMTMEEAHHRWGEGEFPNPVVGNCFSFQRYSRLPLTTSPGWVANGILPLKSKALIFGLPKSGKSYVSSMMAYCIAEGEDWLGFSTKTSEEEPVTLYIQSEIAETELQGRLVSLSSPNAYAETIHGAKLLGRDVDILEERLKVIRPNVLILDPLYMYFDGDLTDIVDVTKCNNIIDQVIEEYRCSVVVVHHNRKPSMDGTLGIIEALGSIGITAFYDSILWLEKEAEGLNSLHFLLRNAKSPEPVILEQQSNGLWIRFEPKLPTIQEWLSPKKLSADMGIPMDRLALYLKHSIEAGKLMVNSFGQIKSAKEEK